MEPIKIYQVHSPFVLSMGKIMIKLDSTKRPIVAVKLSNSGCKFARLARRCVFFCIINISCIKCNMVQPMAAPRGHLTVFELAQEGS